MYRRTGTLTLTALAAGAEADYTITDVSSGGGQSCCHLGDLVVVNTLTAPQAGFSIAHAYVSAEGVITVRVSNLEPVAALTAGPILVRYAVLR